jgi:hypothetical protein
MVEESSYPHGLDVHAPRSSAASRASFGTASSPHGDDRNAMAAAWWGIGFPPWLWATRIRILFIIDGRITTGDGEQEFGLGPVLDTLRYPWFAWWVRISVTVKKRDGPEPFSLTQDGFNLYDFDQVWFFGDLPGTRANPSSVGDDIIEQFSPLSEPELKILAEWMERGGGVFAAGDHSLLGASMCSRIPRVRKMRKWTRAQGVPPFDEPSRHETLVHAPEISEMDQEGDRWAQPIFPVYQHDPQAIGFFFEHKFPHPLLCGRTGVIDHFPDHMHEGCVIEDEDIQLLEPLGIPGYDREEFPIVEPVFEGAAAFGPETFGLRPRPHVIAHGLTTNTDAPTRRFALIGVYDGDPVGIGRIVVDSTWHHWFSMNLHGFKTNHPARYFRMQDYYRNVALWLSTPEQRASMLFAATWGVLVGRQPEAFDKLHGIWNLGQRVLDVIGRTAPQCIVAEMVTTFLRSDGSPRLPHMSPAQKSPAEKPRHARLRPPIAKLTEAVVGGIALELVDLAHHHIDEQACGRSTAIDVDVIRQKGLQGVELGVRELIAAIGESSSQLAILCERLRDTLDRRRDISHIPVSCEAIDDPLK